jgi:hypothetical protein
VRLLFFRACRLTTYHSAYHSTPGVQAKKDEADNQRDAALQDKLSRIRKLQEQIDEKNLLDIHIEVKKASGSGRKRAKKARDDGIIDDDEDIPMSMSLDDGAAAAEGTPEKPAKRSAAPRKAAKRKKNPKEKSEEWVPPFSCQLLITSTLSNTAHLHTCSRYVPDDWDDSNPMEEIPEGLDEENDGARATGEPKRRKLQRDASSDDEDEVAAAPAPEATTDTTRVIVDDDE